MANMSSSYVRRSSLGPPQSQERNAPPNASMVDGSNVLKSLTHHPRQRDQETATEKEQQQQSYQQRCSLIKAFKIVKEWDDWDRRNSIDNSTNVIHKFQEKDDQTKKYSTKNDSLQ